VIETIPLNSTVVISDSIQAVVTAIILRPALNDSVAIIYECEWWSDRDVKTATFSSFQVKPAGDVRPAQIGFHPRGIDG
jgi:hypothetical protein